MGMSFASRVSLAQDFFRFAYRIGTPISHGIKVDFAAAPALVVFGEHALDAEDLQLSDDNFAFCGTLLERLAYRLLAMELNSALEAKFGRWERRCNHTDALIRNSSIVVWIIRNAVAHNVFDPAWKIDDPRWQNQVLSVPGVLAFDTTGLNGTTLKRSHFGGPIASSGFPRHCSRCSVDDAMTELTAGQVIIGSGAIIGGAPHRLIQSGPRQRAHLHQRRATGRPVPMRRLVSGDPLRVPTSQKDHEDDYRAFKPSDRHGSRCQDLRFAGTFEVSLGDGAAPPIPEQV